MAATYFATSGLGRAWLASLRAAVINPRVVRNHQQARSFALVRIAARNCPLLGLGSCASRAPATVSTDSAAHQSPLPERNCSPGTADCDGDLANACEVVLAEDSKNCGASGVQCAAANGESSCLRGTCRMVWCIPGHCDLDGDPKNGCESRTKGCRINKE